VFGMEHMMSGLREIIGLPTKSRTNCSPLVLRVMKCDDTATG
jgi:hypothetical protein